MDMSFVLLQAEGGAAQQPGGGMQQLLMFGLIAIVFYFFMIRPQMRRTKEAKNFRNNLAQGDKVVTIGGIHGKILEVNDDTVLLSVEGSTKLRVEKSSISSSAEDKLDAKK